MSDPGVKSLRAVKCLTSAARFDSLAVLPLSALLGAKALEVAPDLILVHNFGYHHSTLPPVGEVTQNYHHHVLMLTLSECTGVASVENTG